MNPTQYRFEHLATQMKWRLQEGRGEAVYQIGVEDNGLLVGLSEEDMKASLKTLRRMAEKCEHKHTHTFSSLCMIIKLIFMSE